MCTAAKYENVNIWHVKRSIEEEFWWQRSWLNAGNFPNSSHVMKKEKMKKKENLDLALGKRGRAKLISVLVVELGTLELASVGRLLPCLPSFQSIKALQKGPIEWKRKTLTCTHQRSWRSNLLILQRLEITFHWMTLTVRSFGSDVRFPPSEIKANRSWCDRWIDWLTSLD